MQHTWKQWTMVIGLGCLAAVNVQAQNLSKKEMQAKLLAMEQEMTTVKQNLTAAQDQIKTLQLELKSTKAQADIAIMRVGAMEAQPSGKKGGGDLPARTFAPNATPELKAAENKAATKPIDAEKTTNIQFAESVHDFGKIKEGESVTHLFKFKNTGNFPLTITNARGSCGCTVPKYPTEPIAPGASAEIEVKFNSAGKQGIQQKTVTLTANTAPVETVLTIKADVEKKQ